MVRLMPVVSPTGGAHGSPERVAEVSPALVHTSFLLMRRSRGRPVRRDGRVAEVAVWNTAPAQELAVGDQQLVDAAVRRHGTPPREAIRLAEVDQARRRELPGRAEQEVARCWSDDYGACAPEGLCGVTFLAAERGVEQPDPVARCPIAAQERQRALARVVVHRQE